MKVATFLVFLMPASKIKVLLLRRLGHDINRSASVGPIVVINVEHFEMGRNARIGPFNVIRDMVRVHMADRATLGQWNWISAARPLVQRGGAGSLDIKHDSAITSRHYIDASGGIRVGAFTTVAGVRSTLITHGINWRDGAQSFKGIIVGDYCIIGSNTALAPGAQIPDNSVVGMGSTWSGAGEVSGLYVQPRAVVVKSGLVGKYFHRSRGPVDLPPHRPEHRDG